MATRRTSDPHPGAFEGPSWLFNDEHGNWEHRAGVQLEGTAARVLEIGMTDDQVNEEIATYLALIACEACMRGIKSQKV